MAEQPIKIPFELLGITEAEFATKSVKEQLKLLKNAANEVGADGGAAFDNLTRAAAESQDVLRQTNERLKALDPGAKAQQFVNFGKSFTGALQLGTGALQVFGSKNEELQATLSKLQGVINLLAGVQAIADLKRDAGLLRGILGLNKLKVAQTEANIAAKAGTVATGALATATTVGAAATGTATKATKGLGTALYALGIPIILALIGLLVENWDAISASVNSSTKVFDKFGGVLGFIKSLLAGYVEGVKQYFQIAKAILTLDFSKAFELAKGAGAKVIEAAAKSAAKSQAEVEKVKEAKRLEEQIKVFEKQKNELIAQGKDLLDIELKQAEARLKIAVLTGKDIEKAEEDLAKVKGNIFKRDTEISKKISEANKKYSEEKIARIKAETEALIEQSRFKERLAKDEEDVILRSINTDTLRLSKAKELGLTELQIQNLKQDIIEKGIRLNTLLEKQDKDIIEATKEKQRTQLELNIALAEQRENQIGILRAQIALLQFDIVNEPNEIKKIEKQTQLNKLLKEQQKLLDDVPATPKTIKELGADALKAGVYTKEFWDAWKDGIIDGKEGLGAILGEAQKYLAIAQGINDVFNQIAQNRIDKLNEEQEEFKRIQGEKENLIKESNTRIAELEKQLTDENVNNRAFVISQIENEIAINKKLEEQKIAAAKEAEKRKIEAEKLDLARRRRQKVLDILQATITGSLAVLDVFKNTPGELIAKTIAASLAGALAATQIGVIAATKLEKGGLLDGESHSNGGIRGTGRFNNIEVEGGEFVINKQATQRNLPLLQAINKQSFQTGGVLPNFSDISNSISGGSSQQRVEDNRPIVVSVVDIASGLNRVTRIQDSTYF